MTETTKPEPWEHGYKCPNITGLVCPRCGLTMRQAEIVVHMAATDSDLPSEFARFIGGNWVRRYGHMMADDPDFAAAAIYRVMRLATKDPKHFELGLLRERP